MSITRRDLLKASGVGLGAAALGGSWYYAAQPMLGARGDGFQTKHVIVVFFAGGIRRKETIEKPANIPNLSRIMAQGSTSEHIEAAPYGHFGAPLGMLTGVAEPYGLRTRQRATKPGMHEYLRKQVGVDPLLVWHVGRQVSYGHSHHPDYGARFAANVISPFAFDGLGGVLKRYSAPSLPSESEREELNRLSGALGGVSFTGDPQFANPREQQQRIEEFMVRGLSAPPPGSGDQKILKTAKEVMLTYRPTLLTLNLIEPDSCHRNFGNYERAIQANDRGVGELWDAVQNDPELRKTTSIFIVPEHGRDKDFNALGGLDHNDDSDEMKRIFMIAAGPDIKRSHALAGTRSALDLCPTVCRLLGVKAPLATGDAIDDLFA